MKQGLKYEMKGEPSDDKYFTERNPSTLAQNRRLHENFQNPDTDRVPDMFEVLREDYTSGRVEE